MGNLLKLITKLFGKNALSKTLGTRTNVIKLPSNEKKRLIKNDLDIEAGSDIAIQKILKEAEELIAEVPKMNDQERLIFEGNLRRLDNRLNPPSAEVIDIGTKQPVSPTGIKQLTEQAGQMSPPGSLMGNIESRLNQLRASGKKLEDIAKESPSARFEQMLKDPARSGGPLDPKIGIIRTAAREILEKNLKAGKIDIPDPVAKDAIEKVYQGGVDPIDVLRKRYGEGILEQLDDVADELNQARDYKDIQKILEREKLFDAPPKKEYGYDEGVYSDEEMRKILQEAEEPEDFATGGRAGFQKGTSAIFDQLEMDVPHPYGHRVEYGAGGGVKALIKLINKKFGKGTVKLAKDVKRPESAEMREAFKAFKKRHNLAGGGAVKTILKIINEIKKLEPFDAMKEVNKVVAKEGKYKNLSDEEVQKIFDDTNDHIFEREVKPKETDVNFDEDIGEATPMSEIETVEAMGAPITAKTLQLMEKYPGLNLEVARKIASDPDPQRQAEVIAVIDQAFEMNKKGMSMDEIVDVFSKNTDRTKQAEGGLAYLMGL